MKITSDIKPPSIFLSLLLNSHLLVTLLYFWIGPLQGWQLPTTVFRLCHFLLFPLYPHSSYIQGKDLVILYHKRSEIKFWMFFISNLFRVSSEHLFNNLLSNKPKLILHQKDFFYKTLKKLFTNKQIVNDLWFICFLQIWFSHKRIIQKWDLNSG